MYLLLLTIIIIVFYFIKILKSTFRFNVKFIFYLTACFQLLFSTFCYNPFITISVH